jgi:hypothetical protein
MLDIASGRVLKIRHLVDVSGVTGKPRAGDFLVTTGMGVVALVAASRDPEAPPDAQAWNWDNHAVHLKA